MKEIENIKLDEIKKLRKEGLNNSEISRQLNIERSSGVRLLRS